MKKIGDLLADKLKGIQKRAAEREIAAAQAEGRPAATVTPIQSRMIQNSVLIMGQPADEFLFQHTLFCQTVLPYRDPGPEVRAWERAQGDTRLLLEAGKIYDQVAKEYKPVGLPFGPAARLILCHLNTEALRRGSPAIEVEGSMTAFVHRLQGFEPNGAQIRRFKDQVSRLSAALIRMALIRDNGAFQINATIIDKFDLWKDKSEDGQATFPSIIELSPRYFESLQNHAVPLDERAIAAIAHNAMALDVYCWMAQRLHRVDPKRGQFLAWTNLHEQFGQGYERIRDFRRDFLNVLNMVKTQYPAAKFGTDQGGMMLFNSPPPVLRRAVLVGAQEPVPAIAPPIPNAKRLPFKPQS